MRIQLLLLLGLIAVAPSVTADPGFRCGNDLLQAGVGTSRYLVLKKCGEPTYRDGYHGTMIAVKRFLRSWFLVITANSPSPKPSTLGARQIPRA